MVFAVREPGRRIALAGLPELAVEGLRDGDARALLARSLPGPLDERVRDRIVAETHGNPLALLELPRGLTPAELAGGFGLPDRALPGRIERELPRGGSNRSRRHAAAAAHRGGRADRRRHPAVARGERLGIAPSAAARGRRPG